MEKILGLFCLTILLSTCKTHQDSKYWTAQHEQGLYDYLDSITKPNMPDVDKRYKFITFFIKRVEEELPNGINSVSKDSLHNLRDKISLEYAIKQHNAGINFSAGEISYYTRWTPEIEKNVKDSFVAAAKNKGEKVSDVFCECVIFRLKKMYRDSILIPIPQDKLNKIGLDCKGAVGLN